MGKKVSAAKLVSTSKSKLPADYKLPSPQANTEVYRSVRYKSDVQQFVVRTEIGYDLVFELQPQIRVSPYESTEQGTPKFQTQVIWNLKGARPRGNAMKVHEIENLVKGRDVIPKDLGYDLVQLGFVYSTARDPNQHRWWLEGLKAGGKMGEFDSLMSEYVLGVESTAPMGTRSWFDGIHHGRFTFSNDNIDSIEEQYPGHIMINGNGKGKLGDIESNVDIPETCSFVRLRFDVRKDVWYIEMLDQGGNVLSTIVSTGVLSDAHFKGHIIPDQIRPKVSGMIKRSDIEKINTNSQLTMIKAK